MLNLIGKNIITIEHVGSTSVPGLLAKPIIDIAVIVESLKKLEEPIKILREHQYIVRESFEERNEYFAIKNIDQTSRYYIHIVEKGSKRCLDLLIFRNCLIKDKTIREEYEKLKKELALKFPNDRKMYTLNKTEFIEKTIVYSKDRHKS